MWDLLTSTFSEATESAALAWLLSTFFLGVPAAALTYMVEYSSFDSYINAAMLSVIVCLGTGILVAIIIYYIELAKK
jgi:cytochrome c oxidase subunit IV